MAKDIAPATRAFQVSNMPAHQALRGAKLYDFPAKRKLRSDFKGISYQKL